MSEEKKRRYCINFFLLYAHKSRAYFLIFLKSLKFLKPRYFLQKQCFKILVMKKHWEQSSFLPSPSCSSQRTLLYVSVTLCFAKMVTFLVRSRVCCAVVNKLSTLFGFAVHCKMRDFNISLNEFLFIQVFKGNL